MQIGSKPFATGHSKWHICFGGYASRNSSEIVGNSLCHN
jgi:hypothetical protein